MFEVLQREPLNPSVPYERDVLGVLEGALIQPRDAWTVDTPASRAAVRLIVLDVLELSGKYID